jgi:hypothetical protein
MPIKMDRRVGYATPESSKAYEETGIDQFIQSSTRLIFLSKNGAKETMGFLMNVIPDKDYYIKKEFDAFSSSYMKWQSDFCGFILYYNLDGAFSNGWKLIDGKVVSTVWQKSATEKPFTKGLTATTGLICYNTFLLVWYQDCTEWYTNGVYTHTTCGPGYLLMEPWYTICEYVEDEGGGSGGGGIYTGSTSQPYTPQQGDVLFKPAFNNQMIPQMPNTCVTSIMQYISLELCGEIVDEGVFILDYWQTYNALVNQVGVSLDNINEFVQRHFATNTFTGFSNEIDQGRVVMADVTSTISGSAHNVVVVGYHPDGKLIYMDPEVGSLREDFAQNIGINYTISINACI